LSKPAARTIVTGGSGFIGLNLIEALLHSGREVLNLSRSAPRRSEFEPISQPVSVLDRLRLESVVEGFQPTELVHLAARTDFFEEDNRAAFDENVQGARNVIDAVAKTGRPVRSLFASSLVAVADRAAPESRLADCGKFDYAHSKAAMERVVAEDDSLQGPWCILRPGSVWGPWFGIPYLGFFLAIERGRYFHPGRSEPPRCLSYVGNFAFQVLRLLDAPPERIHERTLYLVDDTPTTIRAWSERIAGELGVRSPRTIPGPLAAFAARCGDLVRFLGMPNPPLTSGRLARMQADTTWTPAEPIGEIAGPLPFTLEQGVVETVRWMRSSGLVR